MFRCSWVWALACACACAYSGPVFSTSASCPNGSSGGSGVASAQCGVLFDSNGWAQATVTLLRSTNGNPPVISPDVFALAGGSDTFGPEMWRAQAGLDADYLLTFTGGGGSGVFVACVKASDDRYPGFDDGNTSGTFGVASAMNSGKLFDNSCSRAGQYWAPFTFGVPQVVHASFSASVYSGTISGPAYGEVYLDGIVIDVNGVESMGTYTLDLIIPEPVTAWMVLGGLAVLGTLSPYRKATASLE